MAKSVASSLVCSRLDYANSLLFGTTQRKISTVFSTYKTHLLELLPVMLSLIWYSSVWSALAPNWSTYWIQTCHINVQHPQLLSACLSTFSAQLSHFHTFSMFCQHQSSVGSTCPHNLCLPRFWNSLPSSIRSSTFADTFSRLLKTHCFQQAYCSP